MIIVSPLRAVHDLASRHKATHVVSLLGPESPHPVLERVSGDRHLTLTFHDITEEMPGLDAPKPEHVEEIIEFARNWNFGGPLLIHCWAGISRSTAAAFTTMCALKPDAGETELAQQLRGLSPVATPNRLMVEHADKLLGRAGRMISAVDHIGRGDTAYEGVIFTWEPDT